MRQHLVIFGLILFGILSCSDDNFDVNDFEDGSSIKTLNGTWRVISFEDFIQGKVEFKNQENSGGRDIIVTFDDTKTPHEFSGQNITNSIFGNFSYLTSRQFEPQHLRTTFVGQPEWADLFSQVVLEDKIHFKISRAKLRFYFNNRTKSVTMIRE